MAEDVVKESERIRPVWEVAAADQRTKVTPDDSLADESPDKQARNPEAIQRIHVEEEDKLAFRVGVNLITLSLLGVGIYFLIRYFTGS